MIMSISGVSSKRHFVKSFCALSIASFVLIGSLVSVTAAITGGASSEAVSARISASNTKKLVLDING